SLCVMSLPLPPPTLSLPLHPYTTLFRSSYNHLENMLFAMGKDNDPFSDEAWDYVEQFLDNLDGKIASSSGNVHKGVADGEYTVGERKSTRLKSSHVSISYAVFCWKERIG